MTKLIQNNKYKNQVDVQTIIW